MTPNEQTAVEPLKPCPFCGGEVRLDFEENQGPWYYSIDCAKCGVVMEIKGSRKTIITTWNRRALLEASPTVPVSNKHGVPPGPWEVVTHRDSYVIQQVGAEWDTPTVASVHRVGEGDGWARSLETAKAIALLPNLLASHRPNDHAPDDTFTLDDLRAAWKASRLNALHGFFSGFPGEDATIKAISKARQGSCR